MNPIGTVYLLKATAAYPPGTRAEILAVHKLLGKITHLDLRMLPDRFKLTKVPIDHVRVLEDGPA